MTMPRRRTVTTRTHQAFGMAHELAGQLGHEATMAPHVLIGLMREERNIAAGILNHVWGIPVDVLEEELLQVLPPAGPPSPAGVLEWTPADEQMLARATVESSALDCEYLAGEHLLLAFLRDPASTTARVLDRHGVRYEDVRRDILTWYAGAIPNRRNDPAVKDSPG